MLRVSNVGGVQVYALAAGKSTPDFADEIVKKKQNSLRYDEEFRSRLEILQDFEFSVSSQKVKITEDERYIATTGIYPPEVRLFDTTELSLKFKRGLDSEVIDFVFLLKDYKKIVFLQNDRYVEFHAQGGRHHRLRIPHEGRGLCYCENTAELFIVGSTFQIFRIDLELGEFLIPWESKFEGLNFCKKNPTLPLLCVGGSEGVLESWDCRLGKSVAKLKVVQDYDDYDVNSSTGREITCAEFSHDALKVAVGTSSGVVRIYDIRSDKILYEKNHKNILPIKNIEWIDNSSFDRHSELYDLKRDGCRNLISSCDSKSIKIYDSVTGDMLTTIENVNNNEYENVSKKKVYMSAYNKNNKMLNSIKGVCINHYSFFPNSGLCFVANDQKRLGVFFIPTIGIAPKWCSFLESITEELEDVRQTKHNEGSSNETDCFYNHMYDDYQFVTREQLEKLGVSTLIGTPMLRAYMHGFFMDAQLFRKIKSIAEPFSYEEYRKAKIREKLEEKKVMRITVKQNLPKVNKELAAKLRSFAENNNAKKTKKSEKISKQAQSILNDSRFSRIFKNPEFAIENVSVNTKNDESD